ncbi:OpgC domain-containing protein [Vibrio cholerae]|uniref:OpgC domain-containing protein n=1 Tax=Vibrio cholerae TaxID=666 RepID=UPI0011EF95D3|nr:OpgC domain-containing protein [Vibrio cholerae]TYW43806.1 acyltransferase family protein [Vibrio cholerae]TYW49558.1 acyltransferase family protein [Vibrio cholerae]HDZ9326600.1 OpgC domain-containing protein [Vibrio cholerae]
MKRIPALDSIRGLLLVLITFNHLIWYSGGTTILQMITHEPVGVFGAAEGFIFMSGLLAGMVYSRREYTDRQAAGKVWHRAFIIYKYHIAGLFIAMLWFWLGSHYFAEQVTVFGGSFSNLPTMPFMTMLMSFLLLNKPAYLEILPLYIMYMLLFPLALYGFRRGYLKWVLALSVLIWASSGWIQGAMLLPLFKWLSAEYIPELGYFDPFAWQLLFFFGGALGYCKRQGELAWFHPKFVWLCAAIALVIFMGYRDLLTPLGITKQMVYAASSKPELGWLRVLSLSVWIYLISVVIRFFPTALVYEPLSYLGRHSLQVFTWQTVLIFITAPWLLTTRDSVWHTAIILLLCTTLWIPAWLQTQRKEKPINLSSAVVACLSLVLVMTTNFTSFPQPPKSDIVASSDEVVTDALPSSEISNHELLSEPMNSDETPVN